MSAPVTPTPADEASAEGVEPVAWMKYWSVDGQECCRVDLSKVCEPWLDRLNPILVPLFAGVSALAPVAGGAVAEDAGEIDVAGLSTLHAQIPSGPYSADRRGDGHEVRAFDTRPDDKHHWPYRLLASIPGQTAGCDAAVFAFVAGVVNAWPQIAARLAATPAPQSPAVGLDRSVLCEICQQPIPDEDPGADDESGLIAHERCADPVDIESPAVGLEIVDRIAADVTNRLRAELLLSSAHEMTDAHGIVQEVVLANLHRDHDADRGVPNKGAEIIGLLREATAKLNDPKTDNWTKLKICDVVEEMERAITVAEERRALAATSTTGDVT